MQRTPFDIPDQMRDAADKSVEQARRAFDQFIDATQKAVAKAEGSVKSMRGGAADVNRPAIEERPHDRRRIGCGDGLPSLGRRRVGRVLVVLLLHHHRAQQ